MEKVGLAACAGVLLVLSGCNQSANAGQTARPPDHGDAAAYAHMAVAGKDAPYDTRLPMNEFMEHVMQYAGNGVWKWQGVVLDHSGEHSLYPKNDEDWEEAESGARTLAETTNLLLLPGRRVADAGWDASVIKVREVALEAAEAAERHDKAAFLSAGSALDEACDVCHVRYDPNFRTAPK